MGGEFVFGKQAEAVPEIQCCGDRSAGLWRRFRGRLEKIFGTLDAFRYPRQHSFGSGEPGDTQSTLACMELAERIVRDPGILGGKPVIRGTRLAVEFLLELLEAGVSEKELLVNYPGSTREDLEACRLRPLG